MINNKKSIIKIIAWSLIIVLLFQLFQSIIIANVIVKVFDKINFSDSIVRVIFCVIFAYLIVSLLYKSRKYEKVDNQSVILIWTICVVYTFYRIYPQPGWHFVDIFSNGIKYGDIIYVFVFEYLIIWLLITSKKIPSLIKLFKNLLKKISKESNPPKEQLDSVDLPIKTEAEDKFGYYSHSIDLLSRIISNPQYYSDRALCIGIQAQWGRGKTSFLNLMQSAVDKDEKSNYYNKAIIVKFNPWFSTNSVQITQDFLTTLSEALHSYNPNISSEISRYSRVLRSSELGWLSKLLKVYTGNKINSIEKEFDELNYCISCLRKPVIVFIDDVDRLESEEITMILQLIRNVANFKNTIFIVTYDKEYVVNTSKKDEKYLEKIFTTTYTLPIVSEEKQTEVIAHLMKRTVFSNEDEEMSIDTFLKDIDAQISVRSIKRFLHLVKSKRQRLSNYKLQDIYFYDLLLIEYLHFKFSDVYSRLPNFAVNKILNDINGNIHLNEMNLGKKMSDEELISQVLNLEDKTDESGKIALKILRLLFVNNIGGNPNPYRIRYSNIFNLYFEKSKNSNLISKQDFNNILLNGSNSDLIHLFEVYDKHLIIQLLQTFKLSNESEGLSLLSKTLILIPESLCLLGEFYLPPQNSEIEYRKLYMNILKNFFEDNKKDDLIKLNKKLYLLSYSYQYSEDIFRLKKEGKTHIDPLNKGLGNIYLTYLKRYLSFNPTFDKFETIYIEFLEKIYDNQRQEAKKLLTDYIRKHLQSFIEQATDFSLFVEKFALDRIFAKAKDNLNDDEDNWIIQYKSFLDNQPTKMKEEDWFKNHQNTINTIKS